MGKNTLNVLGNLDLAAALICGLGGGSLLYDGVTAPDTSNIVLVIGGAAILSASLLIAFSITKSKWVRTVWRYRRHLD